MVSVADDSICIINGRRTWKNNQKGYDDPSVGSTKGHGIGNSVDAMKSAKSHKSRDEFETSRERFRTLINRRIMRFGLPVFIVVTFLFYFLFHEGGWIQCSSLFICRRWWRFRRQRHSALSFVLSPIIPLRRMIWQCFILKTGVLSKNIDPDPDTLYPHVLLRTALTDNKPDYPSLACQFDPPVNFAKSYKNMIVEVDAPKFANEEGED